MTYPNSTFNFLLKPGPLPVLIYPGTHVSEQNYPGRLPSPSPHSGSQILSAPSPSIFSVPSLLFMSIKTALVQVTIHSALTSSRSFLIAPFNSFPSPLIFYSAVRSIFVKYKKGMLLLSLNCSVPFHCSSIKFKHQGPR